MYLFIHTLFGNTRCIPRTGATKVHLAFVLLCFSFISAKEDANVANLAYLAT